MKIPFFKPQINDDTIQAVSEVLRSGWLTTGTKTREFEEKFADYVGAKDAVFLNSGTAALHLSLSAIGLRSGDEVITTPFTFAATAEVIEYFNARPIFVDIRDDTLNIDERLIKENITPKTRAIIPVHFAGHSCEMDTIMEISNKHNIHVVEDAAHCTPAYYKERPVGSIGHATCFSFYANKCLTTGEGGMVTTNNHTLAEKIRVLRLHGLSNDAANRYGKEGSWEYDIVAKGYKYNPTDITAAIGLEQLKRADDFWKQRVRIVNRYIKNLQHVPEIRLPHESIHVQSSWHLFPIRLEQKLYKQRARIIERLRENHITTSVHFKPLHMHPYYRKKYGYKPEDYPIAMTAYQGIISLPVYPGLKEEEVQYITDSLCTIIHE